MSKFNCFTCSLRLSEIPTPKILFTCKSEQTLYKIKKRKEKNKERFIRYSDTGLSKSSILFLASLFRISIKGSHCLKPKEEEAMLFYQHYI